MIAMAASFIADNITTVFSAPPRGNLWPRAECRRNARDRLESALENEEHFRTSSALGKRCSALLSEAKFCQGAGRKNWKKRPLSPAEGAAEPCTALGSRRLVTSQPWWQRLLQKIPFAVTGWVHQTLSVCACAAPGALLAPGTSTDPGRCKQRDGRLDERFEASRHSRFPGRSPTVPAMRQLPVRCPGPLTPRSRHLRRDRRPQGRHQPLPCGHRGRGRQRKKRPVAVLTGPRVALSLKHLAQTSLSSRAHAHSCLAATSPHFRISSDYGNSAGRDIGRLYGLYSEAAPSR